jgi:ElaB/YqjD/DUF883 family membrane-anchored ribosome-binding protein
MENITETGQRIRRAAENGGEAGRSEWHRLVADVEDLVKKVAHVDDEEIAHIRAKVVDTLERGEATEATDAYVHDNPWAAVGIAAAVGIIIGFVAGRR